MLFLAVVLAMASCNTTNETIAPAPNHKMIAQGQTLSGKTIKLWAETSILTVAFNRLYISVQKSDSTYIGSSAVSLTPMMDMGTMKHSSPVEQPIFNAANQLYEGAAVFSMPSGDIGSWQLIVKVDEEEISMNINVKAAPANTKYTGTFKGADGISYTLSLIEPKSSKIGINDLLILVNRKENMMSFPAVDGLSFEITTEMPSMGHGSPNNVNPVFIANGRYAGKVNFTMTGDWRIHFKVKKGETVIAEDYALDLLF